MGVKWEYNGSKMGVQWEYDGSTMGVQWEYDGSTWEYMGVQWEYNGSTVGVQWEYSGSTMGVWESRFFPLDFCTFLYICFIFLLIKKFFTKDTEPLEHLSFFNILSNHYDRHKFFVNSI
jgi:hypothetical protein